LRIKDDEIGFTKHRGDIIEQLGNRGGVTSIRSEGDSGGFFDEGLQLCDIPGPPAPVRTENLVRLI